MKRVLKGNFLKLLFNILKKILDLHNDLPFLPEKGKIEKVEKHVVNLNDKIEYVVHIICLKQSLNNRLNLFNSLNDKFSII